MIELDLYFFLGLTFLGLALKLVAWMVVIIPGKSSPAHTAVVYLAFFQITQSIIEYIGYFVPLVYEDYLIYPLTAYYICLIFTLFMIPYIIAIIVKITLTNLFYIFFFLTYSTLIFLLCCTDMILEGARYNGITFTRIPGDYYWLFQSLVISSFSASIFLLSYFLVKYRNDYVIKTKLRNISICCSGLAIFSVSIIFIMPYFDRVNAVGFLPVLMAVFVLGLAHCVSQDNIWDFTYWLPFSKRRRLINRLVKPMITVREDGVDVDIKKEYDAIIAQHALDLFNGSQTKAAGWLKTSQSWVSRHEHSH